MVNLRNEVMVAEKKIGKCFRCGSADHMLRQCPVPFTPVLAFAPNATKGQGRDNRGKGVGEIIASYFKKKSVYRNMMHPVRAKTTPVKMIRLITVT